MSSDYQQPIPAPPPPPAPPLNVPGLLGMIFGIIGIPAAICFALAGLLMAAAGVVLGWIGLKRAADGLAGNRGMALAGVICGSVGALIAIANGILGVIMAVS